MNSYNKYPCVLNSKENTSKFFVFSLILLSSMCRYAHADELDTLQFKAGESLRYDSNIFRLSDTANSQNIIGTSDRSDTIAITTVGVKVDKPYGLQKFELDVNLDHYIYNNFSNLDFTAVNYAAAWRWSLTPGFHGNLTTERQQFVDNNADVQNRGELNRRTDRYSLLDAEYELSGAWRALGGFFERTSNNSQPFTFEEDTKIRGAEVGVRYVFASNTSMAYRFKNGRGEYPDRVITSSFANRFKDREHELRLDWPITDKTSIQSKLAYFERTHEGVSARDFSGVVGHLNATWIATGKTKVVAGFMHGLGSYQTSDISYYKESRFFVAPTWKPTEKTALLLRYEHGVRNYKGAIGVIASNRRDSMNLGSLAFEWEPVRAVKVTASLFRDQRNSNVPDQDYKSNGVGLAVLASF